MDSTLACALVGCGVVAVLSWLAREHSWVDRAWSILPVAYSRLGPWWPRRSSDAPSRSGD